MAVSIPSAPLDLRRKEAIRYELNRILESREFRASQRCRDFLSYVVEAGIEGRCDTLKERVIGIDVFARTAEYDPSDDAIVRVKAGEVRKRLALYYAGPEGSNDPIIIELPLGAYVPTFHDREERNSVAVSSSSYFYGAQAKLPRQPDSDEGVHAEEIGPRESVREPRGFKWIAGMLAVAVLAIGGVGILAYKHYRTPESALILEQFWAPVFKSNEPALICVAPVPVYSLRPDATSRIEPRGGDFVVVRNQFVAIGDLEAQSEIAAALKREKRPFQIRVGNIPFEELRKSPAILVGYSYSQWKEITEIARGPRFSIDLDRKPSYAILDNGVPTDWRIPTYPDDPNLKEDYGIITRLFDPDTGQMLVEIAGISHYGTEGAADVLTDPAVLAQALQKAPAGWQRKDIQIVLHVKVISGTPTAPSIVATYFW